jgi:hypothetical protein
MYSEPSPEPVRRDVLNLMMTLSDPEGGSLDKILSALQSKIIKIAVCFIRFVELLDKI